MGLVVNEERGGRGGGRVRIGGGGEKKWWGMSVEGGEGGKTCI